ncbi:MAG: GNAT family N-acetyltransferase [Lachnospiraceae bacterium]|nr:GNAT family N-acetyltransferase [Lachnospiraceae bacterium]
MGTIRRAEDRDIPRILELLIQVEHVHHLGRPDLFKGPEPAVKYTAEELSAIIHSERTPVFVWTDAQDETRGYAFCVIRQEENSSFLTDIKTLYIDDLCVDEAFRGRRIGREIFDYVKTFAKEIGCYNLTLNVWSCNPGAIAFYETCGLIPQKIGMEMILQKRSCAGRSCISVGD